jgi:hypothetical protein
MNFSICTHSDLLQTACVLPFLTTYPMYVWALAHYYSRTPLETRVSELLKLSPSRSQTYGNFDASMRSYNHSLGHNRSSIYAQEICLYKRPLPLIYTLQVASLEASTRPLCPYIHFIYITTLSTWLPLSNFVHIATLFTWPLVHLTFRVNPFITTFHN